MTPDEWSEFFGALFHVLVVRAIYCTFVENGYAPDLKTINQAVTEAEL